MAKPEARNEDQPYSSKRRKTSGKARPGEDMPQRQHIFFVEDKVPTSEESADRRIKSSEGKKRSLGDIVAAIRRGKSP